MPVAKTYTKMELQGEPFQENGRMYVNAITPKGIKKIRWYTDAEYKRMYPEATTADSITEFDARYAFGFGEKGYILIYKGKQVEEWAESNRTNIWFNLLFGYYTPSKFDCPILADGIEAIQLHWSDVMAHDNIMKSDDEVKKIVSTILNELNTSIFQGEINQWIQKDIIVKEKTSKENHFGTKHTYILEDTAGNNYIWETSAKDYFTNQNITLKMKVKEHKEINGNKYTVVWYCKEI